MELGAPLGGRRGGVVSFELWSAVKDGVRRSSWRSTGCGGFL